MRGISAIVIHHSASPTSWTLENISDAHSDRGFSLKDGTHCGYHFVVEHSGRVRLGRGVATVGAHCRGFNAHSVGVCLIGSYEGEDSPPEEQWEAAAVLCADLLRQYPNATLYGHKELKATLCPGFSPDEFREAVYSSLQCD